MTKNNEEWRPIPGVDYYEASSLGRIRSVARTIAVNYNGTIYERDVPGRVLTPYLCNGYAYCALGRQSKTGVHRYVALAFYGFPPKDKPEAAHRDGDRLNNRADNLRWSSRSDNEQDKRTHGTYFTRRGLKGKDHNKAKLTDSKVLAIRSALTGTRGEFAALAALHDVSPSTVGRIARRELWQHV